MDKDNSNLIKDRCLKRAHELYGSELPGVIAERVEMEWQQINSCYFNSMLIVSDVFRRIGIKDYEYSLRGNAGSILTAFLLGISGSINPMLPHYRCMEAHYTCFEDNVNTIGIHMTDRKCPICGRKLIKDGFRLDPVALLEAQNPLHEALAINVSRSRYEQVVDGIRNDTRLDSCGILRIQNQNGGLMFVNHPKNQDNLCRLDILHHSGLDMLDRLAELTGMDPSEITMENEDIERLLQGIDTDRFEGIPGLITLNDALEFNRMKPRKFGDMVELFCKLHDSYESNGISVKAQAPSYALVDWRILWYVSTHINAFYDVCLENMKKKMNIAMRNAGII